MLHDTLAVQLHIDKLTFPGGDFDWSEEHVKLLISQAIATTDQELESPIKFKSFLIKKIAEEKHWSNIAYIESTEGYFFVTEGLADFLTVVYSRWN